MNKLILIAVLTLGVGTMYGQNLKKGNFVGFHVLTITPSPNVTIEKYLDFFINKVIPEDEKNYECKVYILKVIRGECKNCIGYMVVWSTEAGRDKFFLPEGGLNELGETVSAKMKPVMDELRKLGTYTSKYTDWVVQ